MKIARKLFISGLVQGVGYRYFTQRAAAKHQVKGFVRNLEDGRVETYVEGAEECVTAFQEDLWAGPPMSRVEQIEEIVLDPEGAFSNFIIER
ncbi:MAG: acylphosphatase [Pyrinomonadaceae bacterium]